MAQNILHAMKKSQVQEVTQTSTRLFFIDHLRIGLTILVVLHHIALVYGASAPFYYVEPPFNDTQTFTTLLVFVLFNQAWFMGGFFLLAGYFTPGSFDRKGLPSFLKDRLIRLGIPLIVFIFILNPLSALGVYLMPGTLTGITTSPTWQDYPNLIGLGPLWFVAMLLIFGFIYAGWRTITGNRTASKVNNGSSPGYLSIVIFTLGLALVSYLMRMLVPLGESVNLFVDYLSFPTLAYLPQYFSFFVLGVVAYRNDWFRSLPRSKGVVGILSAIVAGIVLFPLAFSGNFFSLEITPALENAMGNGHWQSAVYVLWDSIFAVGISLGLLAFFRDFFSRENKLGTFLSAHSYAVYIIHIPIVVYLAYLLRNVELANLSKFGMATLIIVPVCFALAFVVRKIPFAAQVI